MTNTGYKHYIMYSFHVLPVVTLSIDCLLNKCFYEKSMIKYPIIFTACYGVLNMILGIGFDIIPYPVLDYKSKHIYIYILATNNHF
jgi:hypothetical protein